MKARVPTLEDRVDSSGSFLQLLEAALDLPEPFLQQRGLRASGRGRVLEISR